MPVHEIPQWMLDARVHDPEALSQQIASMADRINEKVRERQKLAALELEQEASQALVSISESYRRIHG